MRSLIRDPFCLLALLLVATPLLGYAWLAPRAAQLVAAWAAHAADPLFLALAIAALLASRRPTEHPEERRFWTFVTATCAVWFVGNLAPFTAPLFGDRVSMDSLSAPWFFASYVTLVISADFRPHLPAGWTRTSPSFAFSILATLLCVLGMVVCFFVLPLSHRSGEQTALGTSILFVALDLLLVIRFAYLAFASPGPTWAPVYALLTLSTVASTVADGLTLLISYGRVSGEYGTVLDAVWWLPFVCLIAARRWRVHHPNGAREATPPDEEPRTGATEQILVYAFAFPATLLTLDAVGLPTSADPSTRTMVLAALLAFVALAVAQQRVLERRTRDLRSKIRVLVTNEQVLQSQKLEAVGRLAGGLAHDFNNLLTVVMGSADMLVSSLPAGRNREDAEQIRAAAERGAALTRQLLAFSRSQVVRTRAVDLNATVREAEPILRRLVGEGCAVTIEPAGDLRPIEAEPGQIFQVLLNLAANARDAMPRGGTITIRTSNESLTAGDAEVVPPSKGGSYAALEVCDTGVGIDAGMRQRLFEPFSTSKVGGTGLGLAVVYGIAAQGGGHVRVRSEPGRGTRFAVLFPYSEHAAPAAVPPRASPNVPATKARRVLLVDDQLEVREAVGKLVAALGYEVVVAADGPAALAACAATGPPDVLLTDVVMPGMRGDELAARVRASHPGVPVVFMSGFVDAPLAQGETDLPRAGFLAKPFASEALRHALAEALHGTPPPTGAPNAD